MGTRSTAGMAMLYAAKQNDRDAPNHLIKPKIPPEPLEQGGAGGISVFMPARRGCARARPFPDGIPAPVRCVSRQTKGNKAEERLDFCIYRTAKQRFCQGFEDKRGKNVISRRRSGISFGRR